MSNVECLEDHEVSAALTPSSLLEQSREDLVSQMCLPSISYLRSPNMTEVQEAVKWFDSNTEDHLTSDQPAAPLPNILKVYTDVPLRQSEPLSETREKTLNELNSACLVDPELLQLSDEFKPEFHSRHQEAKHQPHPHSIPSSSPPSTRDHSSEIFSFPHHLYVNFHLSPRCPAPGLHMRTLTPSQNSPRFICIPQPNINYHTVRQLIPAHTFSPSHVSVRFPSHLSALNPNPTIYQPMNAEHPSECLNNHKMFSRSAPRDVCEIFRAWQRFRETARGFYSSSPDVEALACFFTWVQKRARIITTFHQKCVYFMFNQHQFCTLQRKSRLSVQHV